jgi:putative membrane protein
MRSLLVLDGLLVFGLCLTQSSRTQDKGTAKDSKAITDREFVYKASEGGLAEVNLGNLAAQRASSAEVKKFGKQMVEDHSKANKELLSIADKKKIPVAPRMDQKHQETADKLSKLSGAEFDRTYMTGQVKDHEETVELFEAQAKNGQDADLKGFAERTLPTIREHLKMARQLADQTKGDKK